MITCFAVGCCKLGTSQCGGCHTERYCGSTCQKASWPVHQHVCQGHLRTKGIKLTFEAEAIVVSVNNLPAILRKSLEASAVLKKLQPRTVDVIILMERAMLLEYNVLNTQGQFVDALRCATDRYSLWSDGHMKEPGMIEAAFPLLMNLNLLHRFEQSLAIAVTVHQMLTTNENNIPVGLLPRFVTEVSYYEAVARIHIAIQVGITSTPAMIREGNEIMVLARAALVGYLVSLGNGDHEHIANAMGLLADTISHFRHGNTDFNDEMVDLYENGIAMHRRLDTPQVDHVRSGLEHMGDAFRRIAYHEKNIKKDVCNYVTYMERALVKYREAATIDAASEQGVTTQFREKMIAVETNINNAKRAIVVALSR